MKIAVISDAHDDFYNLNLALAKATELNCEKVLFAGDLVSPGGVNELKKSKLEVILVWGNNELERLKINKLAQDSNVTVAEEYYEGILGDKKIFMNHYPRYSELAASSGEFDLVVHGHTYELRQEKIGDCLLLCPGSIHSYQAQAQFLTVDLDSLQVETVILPTRQ